MSKRRIRFDITLLLVILLLVVIGLIILYSVSAYNGENKFGDSYYYVKKQIFATSIGLLFMYIFAQLDYHIWSEFAIISYLMSLLLSVAVIFVGDEYNGSRRWLSIGPISFQPSEFSKLAIIIFLAYIIGKLGKKMYQFKYIIFVMAMILPIVGLVGASNLSTAIIILGIGIALIFISTPKYAQFICLGIGGISFLGIFLALESYRLERLLIWRDPGAYDKGFQTIQGLYAIGSGGIFGLGLGNGVQKLGFVPEAQNDMVFSIICEELGIIGASAIILFFMILIWRFYVIASHAKDLTGCLIASGALAHIMIQVVLNIAVVTNTIPNTGITLPFISYGGTSVMFLLMEMGIVINISKTNVI